MEMIKNMPLFLFYAQDILQLSYVKTFNVSEMPFLFSNDKYGILHGTQAGEGKKN